MLNPIGDITVSANGYSVPIRDGMSAMGSGDLDDILGAMMR